MRNPLAANSNSRNCFRVLVLAFVLCALGAMTMLSAATVPSSAITIVNNSSWEIHHLYLSPVDNEAWGPDQLSQTINPGATITLNVSWDQPTVKLVSEDQNGCFLDKTIDATSNGSWTITNDATPNCGN
jgi:hypothetical protein